MGQVNFRYVVFYCFFCHFCFLLGLFQYGEWHLGQNLGFSVLGVQVCLHLLHVNDGSGGMSSMGIRCISGSSISSFILFYLYYYNDMVSYIYYYDNRICVLQFDVRIVTILPVCMRVLLWV